MLGVSPGYTPWTRKWTLFHAQCTSAATSKSCAILVEEDDTTGKNQQKIEPYKPYSYEDH